MGSPVLTTGVQRWPLAALVMRGVANCCGYNPGMAKALAAGYVHARRHPREYAHERDEHLKFGGLWYLDLGDDRVAIAGERFDAARYDREVIAPTTMKLHQPLFYLACEVAEGLPFERMDSTSLVWDRLTERLGRRQYLSFDDARKLVEGLGR